MKSSSGTQSPGFKQPNYLATTVQPEKCRQFFPYYCAARTSQVISSPEQAWKCSHGRCWLANWPVQRLQATVPASVCGPVYHPGAYPTAAVALAPYLTRKARGATQEYKPRVCSTLLSHPKEYPPRTVAGLGPMSRHVLFVVLAVTLLVTGRASVGGEPSEDHCASAGAALLSKLVVAWADTLPKLPWK